MNGDPVPVLYDLDGEGPFRQVEPAASYWAGCPILKSLSMREIIREVGVVPEYPLDPHDELEVLRVLNAHRDDPVYLEDDTRNPLSIFLTESRFFTRTPFGAVLRNKPITTGLELATLFEAETPGNWHRHILDALFDPRALLFGKEAVKSPAGLSPPRQALVWAALDLAISSALQAAWHFKWQHDGDRRVAYRQRPYEFDNFQSSL